MMLWPTYQDFAVQTGCSKGQRHENKRKQGVSSFVFRFLAIEFQIMKNRYPSSNLLGKKSVV